MKVPFDALGATSGRQLYSSEGPNLRQNVDVSSGLESLANGVGRAGDEIGSALQKRAEMAAQKALALRLAQADLKFHGAVTTRLYGDAASGQEGFFSLQGTRASEESAKAFESLQADRAQIAGELPSDVRAQWEAKSSEDLASVRRQMESHVGQQNRAALNDTAKALAESYVKNAYNLDDGSHAAVEELGRQRAQLDASIDGLALSPAGAKAAKDGATQAEVFARIKKSLDTGNVEKAGVLLEAFKTTLGPEAERAQALVDRARAGQAKDLERAKHEEQSMYLMKTSADRFGFIDESKAEEAFGHFVSAVPPEKRDAARAAFDDNLRQELARKKAYVDDVKKSARAEMNRNGNSFDALPGNIVEQLNEYDPDYAAKLQADAAHTAKAARVALSGHKPSIAAMQREVRANDDKAKAAFWAQNLNVEDRAAVDPEEFCTGMKCSPRAVTDIAKAVATAKEQVKRGENGAVNRYSSDLEKQLAPLTRGKKPALDGDAANAVREEFQTQLEELQAKNKRLPSAEEAQAIRSGLLANKAAAGVEAATKRGITSFAGDVAGAAPKLSPQDAKVLEYLRAHPDAKGAEAARAKFRKMGVSF